ncbi:MAG TPA: hypothetical protein VMI34_05130 [Candidatus Bathyarchaeia archaeon]|nr:hypothetical protein [Candidatus Bathyarchaeia archaeon]
MSRARILEQLKLAARKGDRGALLLAMDQMKTLAYSPRYWESYLELLAHPLARLVDLLVIKQGAKIAHQKGWTRLRRARPAKPSGRAGKAERPGRRSRRKAPAAAAAQGVLFPDLVS